MNVAAYEPFVRRALGLFLGLRRAAFKQQCLGFCHVATGFDERFAAIHHRRAGLFTQRFDLVGFRLIGH